MLITISPESRLPSPESPERRQAPGDLRDDGFFSPLGAKTELARNRTGLSAWEAVYRSVEWFVEWGLTHRELRQVESIGVDEIHWGHGLRADNFLTVIYQIDMHCRRLLWVGKRRPDDAVAGSEDFGVGSGGRFAFRLQRHVEALSQCHRRRSGASVARVRSFPYHHPFE